MKGITFGTKHSYNDFGLILNSKQIGLPEPKTETIDIPGRDGKLGLTNAISDTVKYKNRPLNFTFTKIGTQSQCLKCLEDITNYLQGQKLSVILDDDPSYYYYGRCTVNTFSINKKTSTIVISVDAEPYKTEVNASGEKWLWDTFSFKYGVIRVSEFTISGTQTINLTNLKKIVSPTFICSSDMTATFNGITYNLKKGEQTVYGIRLQEGDNYITFTGNGTLKVQYKGGSL